MYFLILILPLFSGIVSGLFGRFCGRTGSSIISTGIIFLTAFFSWLSLYEIGINSSPVSLILTSWIETELLNVNWGFLFDSITSIMLVVITSISGLVHLYSMSYMSEDPHLQRFFSYLSFFTFFMLILVSADNFLVLFVGWEGVGILSFLLINFWFTRIQANKGAINALIMNRIGDFGLTIAMFSIFREFGTLDYASIFSMITEEIPVPDGAIKEIPVPDGAIKEWIGLFLIIGVMGKSAQLLLHIWLPQSMEGPTPVSALLHAATMVTGGIFLIIRCSPIFEQVPIILNIMTIIGALTAFFAASSGLLQNDIKKIIAFSTCSQLGYLLVGCGLSNYNIALFHLFNHAWFKALLFLSAGSIIHALNDEQDIRKMGGLKTLIPFTYLVCLIGSLSLMGFPFLTGFWSKDAILEVAAAKETSIGLFASLITIITAAITAFYSLRLLILIFMTRTNIKPISLSPCVAYPLNGFTRWATPAVAREGGITMIIPLLILGISSVIIGYLLKDLFIGLGSNFFGNAILINPKNSNIIEAEFQDFIKKILPLIISILSAGVAIMLYILIPKFSIKMKTKASSTKGNCLQINIRKLGRNMYIFLNQRYLFETIYNKIILKFLLNIGYNHLFKKVDRGILEIIGPEGLERKFIIFANKLNLLQTGILQQYGQYILIGIIFVIISPIIISVVPIKLYYLIIISLSFAEVEFQKS